MMKVRIVFAPIFDRCASDQGGLNNFPSRRGSNHTQEPSSESALSLWLVHMSSLPSSEAERFIELESIRCSGGERGPEAYLPASWSSVLRSLPGRP